MKLSIIIPVYNEVRVIDEVIKKVKDARLPAGVIKEIVIIDDGSTDGTYNRLKKYGADSMIKIYYNSKNCGKTAAVKAGIIKSEGDMILIQDADLEYSPTDYPALIEPIINNKSSVVYGSRFKGKIEKMAFRNRIANIISNITLNILFGTKISDVNTCYKVFKREIFNELKIESKDFTFDTEITSKLLKAGYKIYEVPIKYAARSKKDGKKMSWLSALQVYWGIIKFRFSHN